MTRPTETPKMALNAWINAMYVAVMSIRNPTVPRACVGCRPTAKCTTRYITITWQMPMSNAGQYEARTTRSAPSPFAMGRFWSGLSSIQVMMPPTNSARGRKNGAKPVPNVLARFSYVSCSSTGLERV